MPFRRNLNRPRSDGVAAAARAAYIEARARRDARTQDLVKGTVRDAPTSPRRAHG
jgi:hypothetical protein